MYRCVYIYIYIFKIYILKVHTYLKLLLNSLVLAQKQSFRSPCMECMSHSPPSSVLHLGSGGSLLQDFSGLYPCSPDRGARSRHFIPTDAIRVPFPGIEVWDREKGESGLEPKSLCWSPCPPGESNRRERHFWFLKEKNSTNIWMEE